MISRAEKALSPRTAVKGVVLLGVMACADAPTLPRGSDESSAATWKTWVLASGSELRPPAPPSEGSAEARSELDEVIRIQAAKTAVSDSVIRHWDGRPTDHWHEKTLDLLGFYWPLLPDVRIATPARSARILSLVNVAMYDALVAVWDAKAAYRRPAPSEVEGRITRLAEEDGVSSYPSMHAAVAAAAAGVLSHLFAIDDTLRLHALEREAGDARIAAGVAYRSDVDAGYAIGRAVAARVIARAMTDGSSAVWTEKLPTDSWAWRPTPPRRVQIPFDPLAGGWKTWTIPTGASYRPLPPPLPGSPRFTADLNELLLIGRTRTVAQADTARYWATEAPSARWELFMRDEIATRHLSPVRAARALALASTAMSDAMIACWDAKFAYWLERPITADSTLRTAVSTPPFPSYPSGHSTQSAAAAEVFAYLFPDRAAHYRALADEASYSRVLGGIHFRFDIVAGEELGRRVGAAAVARAKADGAR